MMLQFQSLGNVDYPFITITLSSRLVVSVMIPSKSKIELFNHVLNMIVNSYLSSYNSIHIDIRLEYLINRITNVRKQYFKQFNC